jgi:hypothetical protein
MTTPSVDLQQAKNNPGEVFADPADVLTHPGLSRDAKIEILRQWEVDARLLATAENENMQGGERNRLGAVVIALLMLEDDRPH